MAFSSTINREDFKRLQRACFGSAESSVPAQVRKAENLRELADEITELMRNLGCKGPGLLPLTF